MKVLFRLTLLALLVMVAVLGINTWRLPADRRLAAPAQMDPLDQSAIAAHLAAAIAIPTVSPSAEAPGLDNFMQLHALLASTFPRVHAELTREVVNGASLLYRWRGKNTACAPLLLIAHEDVVPIEPGTESHWSQPPFSGRIADGFVWGRGAIDDKALLMAELEAVEAALAEGRKPRCDVLLAFGHDEEVGGREGAQKLAERLQQLGIRPAMVVDEGGSLTEGVVPGVDGPIATIGVAEKGYLSVRLTLKAEGGHSSMPPRHTVIGRLAAAISRLEAAPMPADLGSVQREMLRRLAPRMSPGRMVAMANLWLFAPLVERVFTAVPATDAAIRTTTAPTLFHAGVRENVLPQQAEAIVNFRIRPGDSVDAVLAHVRRTIEDAEIEIEPFGQFKGNPTVPAPWDNAEFASLEHALRAASPQWSPVVAPYVTNGGTDARHYAILTDHLYRVGPFLLHPADLQRMHGTDERIAITEYARCVRFFRALLREWT